MKKAVILCLIFIVMVTLTACMSAADAAKDTEVTTIEMESDENYDDADPFINEKLFCVSEDLDNLAAKGTFEMDG